ncbi:hypothetical protein Q7P37_010260 [Cladosporium fusiforme]
MESLNGRPIIGHLQGKFLGDESSVSLQKIFSEVSWNCLFAAWGDQYVMHEACKRHHGKGHGVALLLLNKSSGNFLLATLATESVCERVDADLGAAAVRKHIDELPTKLTDYLPQSVIGRVSDTWRREKPVASKMALNTTAWFPFWTLWNSDLKELPGTFSWLTANIECS